MARIVARIRTILADRSDSRLAQLIAGEVFLLRVANAMIALGSQVLLARWMGRFEFGVYIYVWTWVLMIGSLSDVGLSTAARRFIPEYTELGDNERLRGFLTGGRWLALGVATAIAVVGAIGVTVLGPWIDNFAVIPLYLACVIIPITGVSALQTGIAQSYNWPMLALVPFFTGRQVLLTAAVGAAWFLGYTVSATVTMIVAIVATWAVTAVQIVLLNRRLAETVPKGPKRYAPLTWLGTSLPILVVEGFYLMLTYVDIIALERFRPPGEVAVYYAAARILAVVAFVYFAIAGATTHKFTQYYIAGNHERLATFFNETIRWTFWPSLIACGMILIFGRLLLSLFGAGFTSGYLVMFILAVGMMARAAVGPAERLLNMLGERKQCAGVYALAFVINLGLCIVLIPRLGMEGAATATSTALVVESILLFFMTRRRLGHHVFILRHAEQ
ncbi:MAG: polysaccharide biosynthesis C-terminal domain-containing protein [Pseudolabrys sp.]